MVELRGFLLGDNYKKSNCNCKIINMEIKEIVTLIISFALGLLTGAVVTYYFFKKQIKKIQEQFGSLDKESLRNMSSALGRKLSEEQLNKMLETVESLKKKGRP